MPISKLAISLLILTLAACGGLPQGQGPVKPRALTLNDIAKSDIDMVAEVSARQSRKYLRELAAKLYRRNPNQLRRSSASGMTVQAALQQLFNDVRPLQLRRHHGAAAIGLAFDVKFDGDRVAAFITGLRDMQRDAYGGEYEFFLHHEFDPQRLYHLARNIEIASWRLRHMRQPDGLLFLLSSGPDDSGVHNLSYERLFGKLIALQDHFAHVVADTTNRRIKNAVQSMATAVFFPI